jgi:hypothetical protein
VDEKKIGMTNGCCGAENVAISAVYIMLSGSILTEAVSV